MEPIDFKKAIIEALANDDSVALDQLHSNDKLMFFRVCSPVDTWLHSAVDEEAKNCIQYLAGVMDVNTEDDILQVNALALAAAKGYLDIVRLLLNLGAEIQQTDSAKNPIFGAISSNSEHKLSILKTLVEHGADLSPVHDTLDYGKVSAFDYAKIWGDPEVIEYLRNQINQRGQTRLI